MGIPVELVGIGPDWPAWVQAVGSVAAILIAVVIDRGQFRRSLSEERRRRVEARQDWEEALSQCRELIANAHRLAGIKATDQLDDTVIGRLVDNAIMMLDAYLRQPPPNPRIVFAMSAARSYIEVARSAIRDRRESDQKFLSNSPSTRVNMNNRIQLTLKEASENLNALEFQYIDGAI